MCAEGEALASAWEPTNPHDEALLIATVPKLHGKSTPMYAGGKPPAQPWCGAKLSLRDSAQLPDACAGSTAKPDAALKATLDLCTYAPTSMQG